jgi:hypothetical protein
MILSTILWANLQEKLCKILNIYPALLHAQYQLSTDMKGSLLFDFISHQEFQQLINIIQPLVVPPCLANGWRSKKQIKEVTVSMFQKGDSLDSQARKSSTKVSSTLSLLCLYLISQIESCCTERY